MSKLLSYPNMCSEILEAIHLMYEDDPQIEVDCYLCLSELRDNFKRTVELSDMAINRIEDMGRCPDCGELMQARHYREPHPELEGCPYEDLYEHICPNCDLVD